MSHRTKIREYLEAGNTVTAIEALEKFNCFRLAARIDALRREGLDIETEFQNKNGKRFASYGLAGR